MKIYLFLSDEILTFSLPKKVFGNFSFDEDNNKEEKLINIEANNSSWLLYSTEDVSIISNGTVQKNIPLKIDSYYILTRDNMKYLIYVTDAFDNSFSTYNYNDKLNLVIGNDNACNIKFNCNFFKGILAKVVMKENKLLLEAANNTIYINNKILRNIPYTIKIGDTFSIYGLKIIFFNGFLLINNPGNNVTCDLQKTNLSVHKFMNDTKLEDFEVKDIDLYKKDDYFSKSPRVRRSIKTKEIKFTKPPNTNTKNNEMPFLLNVGPRLAMTLSSVIMLSNNISKVTAGERDLMATLPSLISSGAMLLGVFLWPNLTKKYKKNQQEKEKKEKILKYSAYLKKKEKEFSDEEKLQRNILVENLIPIEECLKIIDMAKINFWDKRMEQSDFLDVRIGFGNALLDVKINWPEEDFSMEEDDLKKQADALVEKYKYIKDVPVGYSLLKNRITAIMNEKIKAYGFINNIILQLITFYSYEDIKLVVFTNEKNKSNWEYLKYLNHTFTNDKSFRFFASNADETKNVANYLSFEFQNRQQIKQLIKPYYIIICDDYSQIKRFPIVKAITESDANLGFSLLILEDRMSKLPSKCNNFIMLGTTTSELLINSVENPEQIVFKDQINLDIDMMKVANKLSNIPIEFEEGGKELPESVTFLEMEKVGKIEHLNIMNRWETNDSTTSLKAEVGVDEEGTPMYLDLHEKFHGPHGLIAGMTGSGKSEFIITYILSMAINYSPDDVAFILIDYKGGGLAGAFENKITGIELPHLAGTITNLDKAEMDRTLVSIDSEVKRRQEIFNNARDTLSESTIDIYKYQRFYKEGKLNAPVPHLFIICDEFAELKSQQPEFMNNLISVARIGRSLGVHLILATQKPSGVVNDQIWSNSKFRVCLKVQTASDSNEMLKRPDAASLKQAGRFYIQVGYDEYFALGQSGWCGAKYYPSDKIIKQVDKSINFIGNTGNFIKSIEAGKNIKVEAQGEQISAIMKEIIEVAKLTNKKAKRLWLADIDPIILVDNLEKKYEMKHIQYDIEAAIGEYDAPEKQTQGLLTYSVNKDGNTAIFGTEEAEREKLLNTIIYAICKNHSAKEVNIYIADFGSESTRIFNKFPQIGGMIFAEDDEKFKNLIKLITNEIKTRKKLLVDYGGSIDNYNSQKNEKLSRILFMINNYEGLLEIHKDFWEFLSSVGRDCERYGVVLILTCSSPSNLGRKTAQCFQNKYSLHLNDNSLYFSVFNMRCRVYPRDSFARGLVYNDGIHEFQTASIVENEHVLNNYVKEISDKIIENDSSVAVPIPTLPKKITYNTISDSIKSIKNVPIGIYKDSLDIVKYDFSEYPATSIGATKLEHMNLFISSLLDVLLRINDLTVFFIDTLQLLPVANQKQLNNKKIYYFSSNFEENFEKLISIEKKDENKKYKKIYIFYGIEKLKNKIKTTKIDEFFNMIKSSENSNMIFCDGIKNFKALDFEPWYSKMKNNTDGIWLGKGFSEQTIFRITRLTKDLSTISSKKYGVCIKEGSSELMKVLDFYEEINSKEDEEDEE